MLKSLMPVFRIFIIFMLTAMLIATYCADFNPM